MLQPASQHAGKAGGQQKQGIRHGHLRGAEPIGCHERLIEDAPHVDAAGTHCGKRACRQNNVSLRLNSPHCNPLCAPKHRALRASLRFFPSFSRSADFALPPNTRQTTSKPHRCLTSINNQVAAPLRPEFHCIFSSFHKNRQWKTVQPGHERVHLNFLC